MDREKSGLGVSIILCSSEKGVSLIKNSSSNFIIEKHDISETFKFNPRLLSPVTKNDYVKKLGQCHILIRGLTRRISLRTIETALPETANPNETVPVNKGYCLRPLPFPQGMTVE